MLDKFCTLNYNSAYNKAMKEDKMEKWERREQKQNSKRRQMNKSGRSIFTVVRVQVKRAEQIRAEKGYKKGQDNG